MDVRDETKPPALESYKKPGPASKISLIDSQGDRFYDCNSEFFENIEAVDEDGDKQPFLTGMLSKLCSGSYGNVVESIDISSGIPIALKISRDALHDDQAWYSCLAIVTCHQIHHTYSPSITSIQMQEHL